MRNACSSSKDALMATMKAIEIANRHHRTLQFVGYVGKAVENMKCSQGNPGKNTF